MNSNFFCKGMAIKIMYIRYYRGHEDKSRRKGWYSQVLILLLTDIVVNDRLFHDLYNYSNHDAIFLLTGA